MTRISIIVPIYNVEKYLKRCVDSILNQTLSDIEVILATDGGDECDRICEEYKNIDERVVVLSHPGSYGKAFNKGVEIAKGEYIGIIEADDWIDNKMYEKLYSKAIEYDKADVVKCGFWFAFDNNNKNYNYLYRNHPEDFSVFNCPKFLGSQPSVWNCIYKKSFLVENNIRMIEERQSFIDSPFHYETLYKANKYILLNEPLYYYYQDNPNQTVQNVKLWDGLNAEKYAYNKLKQLPDIYNELKEGFIYTTVSHLLWNYERLKTDEQKVQYWLEAHKYILNLDILGVDFIYFPSYLKEFYNKLKNSRCSKYLIKRENKKIIKTTYVKLFKIIPIYTITEIIPNCFKYKLFNILPIFNIDNRFNKKKKVKLFGIFNILSFEYKEKVKSF